MNLPQALRLAGHLHVCAGVGTAVRHQRCAASTSRTANKMLVMIDGRTVYSPVFAGVFWEAQDLVIADIDRIEVMRGPGGTRVGRQRRQRRHQRHHEERRRHARHVRQCRGRDEHARPVRGAARRPLRQRRGRIASTPRSAFEDGRPAAERRRRRRRSRLRPGGFPHRIRTPASRLRRCCKAMSTPAHRAWSRRPNDQRWPAATCSRAGRAARHHSGAETTVQAYYDHFYRRVPGQYRGALAHRSISTRSTMRSVRPSPRRLRRRLSSVSRRRSRRRARVLLRAARARLASLERVRRRTRSHVRPRLFVTARIEVRAQRVHRRRSAADRARCAGARGAQTLWGAVSRAVRVPTRFDTDLRFRVPEHARLCC